MTGQTSPDMPQALLQQRTKELQTLVRVAQLINVIDLDFVLSQTLQLTAEVANATKGSFFLVDSQGQPIQRFLTQRDMPPEISRQVARDVLEKGLAGWCIQQRQGTLVSDITQDNRWYHFPDDPQDDVRSALCVPVSYEKQLQGVMTLVNDQVGHFSDHDLRLVEAIASQASTAIRNAQLFDDLQSKQRQLELILESNAEALLTVDDNYHVMLANPEARNLLADPEKPLVGQDLAQVDSTSIYGEVVKRLQVAPKGMNSLSFELRDKSHERDYVVNVVALRQNDLTQGYVITIHDVTSIKEFDHLKTTMLHMLSHDMKSPINVIWGYVDLLRVDSLNSQPADSRFIDGILRALKRMENLIENTLEAERLMAAGIKQAVSPFSPTVLVAEAVESTLALAEQKQQTLQQEIQLNLPEMVGTAFQLREAMINLINNAIKYTPEKGTITISASCDGERFKFSVKDTGMGIPQHLQHKIFTKFYRANRPEMAAIKGTGLGLNLVKTAVESHKGQVWFESQDGVGSTFGFWIPLSVRHHENKSPSVPPTPTA